MSDKTTNTHSTLNRRNFIAGATAVAGLALSGTVAAAASHGDHAGHDHGHDHGESGHGGHAKNEALVKTALDCVGRANACIDHCIEQLGKGNTAMADCAASVQSMEAACTALAKLAALGAPRLPEMAAACREICKDCETECRKHEKMAVCIACADSCAECIKACDKVAA